LQINKYGEAEKSTTSSSLNLKLVTLY